MDLEMEIKKIQDNRENALKKIYEAWQYEALFFEGKYDEIESDEEFLFQLKNWILKNELLIDSKLNHQISMLDKNVNFINFVKENAKVGKIASGLEEVLVEEMEQRFIEHERRRDLVKKRIQGMRQKEVSKDVLSIASSLFSVIPEVGALLTVISLIKDAISANGNSSIHKDIEDMLL